MLIGYRLDAAVSALPAREIAAMDEARRRGLRVPEGLRVIGCDAIEPGGWASYGPTTFAQGLDEMAARLIRVLDGECPSPGTSTVAPALVRRRSA